MTLFIKYVLNDVAPEFPYALSLRQKQQKKIRASLLFVILGCCSQFLLAQPIKLQLATAHNDKLQKEYSPYRNAVEAKLGSEFMNAHKPVNERRLPCKWDDKWVECGYFRISNGSLLTAAQRVALAETLINPCATLFAQVDADKPQEPAAIETENSRAVRDERERLQKLCRNGVFSATSVRLAHQIDKGRENNRRRPQPDSVGFEMRIKESK